MIFYLGLRRLCGIEYIRSELLMRLYDKLLMRLYVKHRILIKVKATCLRSNARGII
jgi:hypothetical protein